jgi:hypothetical protein
VSRYGCGTHSHVEPSPPIEKSDALVVSEQYLSKMLGASTRDRIAKAGSPHGAVRTQAHAEAAAKLIADFEKLSPLGRQRALKQLDAIKADADASRLTAKPPASGLNDTDFVAWADVPGSDKHGSIEHVESHGINVGVRNGILSLRRLYLPGATNRLAQLGAGS